MQHEKSTASSLFKFNGQGHAGQADNIRGVKQDAIAQQVDYESQQNNLDLIAI